ncbi:hypothetical protein GCM10007049_14910 [Echinicola pacifica]|uniref:Peptidyl-prolyl cis-trans isomerase n=1 Tax=Echinicola pacifica TaxID=346377 RepID=A0A918PV98_9BACT|nr:hypothetical protein GCM10007049_14910 [Echinicola pacifica]
MACIALCLTGCDFFKIKTEDQGSSEDPVVAAVDDILLKKSDLDFVTRETTSLTDSSNLAKRYIQSWVKKQVMIREASKSVNVSQAELDKKLLDYKYALIVYEYEKEYIEKNLNREVSAGEIEQYYEQNKDNFTLKEIIVRANYIKIEKELNQNKEVQKLMASNSEGSSSQLRELAITAASNYFLEDSTWIKFDEITLNTPLADHQNKVQLLTSRKKPIIVENEGYNYYFNILEYKLQDQVPPVDFVKDEISEIIINKRKVNLAESLQNQVYKRAQDNNEFRIYE